MEAFLKQELTRQTRAFEDQRFPPIPETLLPSLSCSITTIGPFMACEDAFDWSLGEHGIHISFSANGKHHQAQYLDWVPGSQGWDKEEALKNLMRKHGWELPVGSTEHEESRPWEHVEDFTISKFLCYKETASFAEWQEWRREGFLPGMQTTVSQLVT